jgi:hypothetical protein
MMVGVKKKKYCASTLVIIVAGVKKKVFRQWLLVMMVDLVAT